MGDIHLPTGIRFSLTQLAMHVKLTFYQFQNVCVLRTAMLIEIALLKFAKFLICEALLLFVQYWNMHN